MYSSIGIKRVVDTSDGVSSGLENTPNCIACEIIFTWMHMELADNQSRDSLLNLGSNVSCFNFSSCFNYLFGA